MVLTVLLNDGRMGEEATNSIWHMKQGDLKTSKRKVLKTALWMRPDNLLATSYRLAVTMWRLSATSCMDCLYSLKCMPIV